MADNTEMGSNFCSNGLRPALARPAASTPSNCVSTADGVSSAVIRTGQTRVGQALDSGQDRKDIGLSLNSSHEKGGSHLEWSRQPGMSTTGSFAATGFISAKAVVSARRSRTSSKAIDKTCVGLRTPTGP
ncbi:hypothetical protein N7465_007723 [Penicillium sp. CMV-2018d]|nr:hypothetical protein N7465_007723 [Penicillium sp. CMV-2018d]